jgi:hypothetical protein
MSTKQSCPDTAVSMTCRCESLKLELPKTLHDDWDKGSGWWSAQQVHSMSTLCLQLSMCVIN